MKRIVRLLLLFFLPVLTHAQDPTRFEEEVREITAHDAEIPTHDIILFTGSSSIRMWKDLDERFPGLNVLNRGFGGSVMSDLVYYADRLVLPYLPKKIFIYEGDNDINAGKSTDEILADADRLLAVIRSHLPGTVPVIFISPKPSLARWNLRDKYTAYNKALKKWAASRKNVTFVDVWTPMLDEKGEVFNDIFIGDGLHMNSKGYDIWTRVLAPYLLDDR